MPSRAQCAGLLLSGALAACGPFSGDVYLAREAVPDARADAGNPLRPGDAGPSGDAGVADGAAVVADLTWTSLAAPPAWVGPGSGLQLAAEVEARDGTTTETAVWVELVPDRPDTPRVRLGEARVPPLGPGGRASLELDLWVPSGTIEQRYTVEARLDPADLVPEVDERDNVRAAGALWVSSLAITPGALDFGTVGLGCTATRTLTLQNRAQATAVVTEVSIEAPTGPFSVRAPALPAPVASGALLEVPVVFAPTRFGLEQGSVLLDHARIVGGPVRVPIAGGGAQDPVRRESFQTWPGPRLDVLVVLDDSPTMVEEQAAVTVASGAFLEGLRSRQIDFHVGVTTTDMSLTGLRGRLRGLEPVITPRTPSAAHELANNVRVGTGGSEAEQGLAAAVAALRFETNPAFRRPEAAVWLVIVSDEDDASPDDLASYAQALTEAAPAGLWLTTVTGDADAPCPASTAPGVRYRSLTHTLGGETRDLCAFAWDDGLEQAVPERLGRQVRFELGGQPLAGSVTVVVDGARVQGWRLEGATLVFEGDRAPEPGSTVRVEYRTGC